MTDEEHASAAELCRQVAGALSGIAAGIAAPLMPPTAIEQLEHRVNALERTVDVLQAALHRLRLGTQAHDARLARERVLSRGGAQPERLHDLVPGDLVRHNRTGFVGVVREICRREGTSPPSDTVRVWWPREMPPLLIATIWGLDEVSVEAAGDYHNLV